VPGGQAERHHEGDTMTRKRKRTHQRPAQTPRQRRIAAFRRIGNDYLAATELAELAELAAPAEPKGQR
jgi:hypothetical protein